MKSVLALACASLFLVSLAAPSGLEPITLPKRVTKARGNLTYTPNLDSGCVFKQSSANKFKQEGTGLSLMTQQQVDVYMIYYGNFVAADMQFLNIFVENISQHPWYNSINSYFTKSNVYAASLINLAAQVQVTNVLSTISGAGNDLWTQVIAGVITANNWPLDTNTIYVVLPGPNVVYPPDNSCAWHTSYSTGSNVYKYALIHNQNSCAGQSIWPESNIGILVQTMATTLYHEIIETITDFDGSNGWYSTTGDENGDLCAWCFGSTIGAVTFLPNGAGYNVALGPSNTKYLVQETFDIRTLKCTSPGPANLQGHINCTVGTCAANQCLVGTTCKTFPPLATSCPPTTVTNGNSIPATNVGGIATISCASGFVAQPVTISCMLNGHWSKAPQCVASTTATPATTSQATAPATTTQATAPASTTAATTTTTTATTTAPVTTTATTTTTPTPTPSTTTTTAAPGTTTTTKPVTTATTKTKTTTTKTTKTTSSTAPHCSLHATCSSCVADAVCGWCASGSGACYLGTATGAAAGSNAPSACIAGQPNVWDWFLNSCPVVSPCSAFTTCASCTAYPICGWCSAGTGACFQGYASGSTDPSSTCLYGQYSPFWDWVATQCPIA